MSICGADAHCSGSIRRSSAPEAIAICSNEIVSRECAQTGSSGPSSMACTRFVDTRLSIALRPKEIPAGALSGVGRRNHNEVERSRFIARNEKKEKALHANVRPHHSRARQVHRQKLLPDIGVTTSTNCRHSDLPLNFHPAAIRALANVTPFGAVSTSSRTCNRSNFAQHPATAALSLMRLRALSSCLAVQGTKGVRHQALR